MSMELRARENYLASMLRIALKAEDDELANPNPCLMKQTMQANRDLLASPLIRKVIPDVSMNRLELPRLRKEWHDFDGEHDPEEGALRTLHWLDAQEMYAAMLMARQMNAAQENQP